VESAQPAAQERGPQRSFGVELDEEEQEGVAHQSGQQAKRRMGEPGQQAGQHAPGPDRPLRAKNLLHGR
jgi:hypothetical protein